MLSEQYKIIQNKCLQLHKLCNDDNYILKYKRQKFNFDEIITDILDGLQGCIYFSGQEGGSILSFSEDNDFEYCLKIIKDIQIYKLQLQENNL